VTAHETARWRGVVALSLFAAAVGLLAQRPSVLLLATLGAGYAVYPRLVTDPPDPAITVDRSITPAAPSEGDAVSVAVTVRNDGDRWLADIRLVDGVPSLLPVVEGTPRRATALGPGEETTIEYTVAAKPGKHRFEPMTVVARDASGAIERRTTVTEPDVIDCGVSVSAPALRRLTRQRTGTLLTDDGGSGIEFHGVREYRPGDAMGRVDWRRFARDGELTTVEFRQERAGAVVLCVDVGPPHDSPDSLGGEAHDAVARSVAAADRLADILVDANHGVGLATLGQSFCWLAPDLGSDHLRRVRLALDEHPAFVPRSTHGDASSLDGGPGDDPPLADVATRRPDRSEASPGPDVANLSVTPGGPVSDGPTQRDRSGQAATTLSDGGQQVENGREQAGANGRPGRERQTDALLGRLGPSVQVTMLTPLADDGIVESIRSLEVAGHAVTVVSPDATSAESVGTRLAATERARRVRMLRRNGVPVVDWHPDDHLGTELVDTLERFR